MWGGTSDIMNLWSSYDIHVKCFIDLQGRKHILDFVINKFNINFNIISNKKCENVINYFGDKLSFSKFPKFISLQSVEEYV